VGPRIRLATDLTERETSCCGARRVLRRTDGGRKRMRECWESGVKRWCWRRVSCCPAHSDEEFAVPWPMGRERLGVQTAGEDALRTAAGTAAPRKSKNGRMVKNRAADSSASGISFRRALFLAGAALVAVTSAWSICGCAGIVRSCARVGACAQE